MAVKAPPNVNHKADAFVAAGAQKPAAAEDSAKGRMIVNLRLDRKMVGRIDRYAELHGLNRTAAIHVLINTALPPTE
jgi:hypothetical protein